MGVYCLIADQIVRIADGRLGRLLFDFRISDEAVVDEKQVLCHVYVGEAARIHGVRCFHACHPVAHAFINDLDPFGVLMTDEGYEHMTVCNPREENLADTMLVGVYSCLIPHKTVFAHAALIALPDYGGILFIGDSGVGKTTQARLWARHRGASVLNGDKVFLALRPEAPEQVLAYGSPWTGSSPYRVNGKVPLRAIVSLVRRDSCSVRRLSETEAMGAFVSRIYMPAWDGGLTQAVMDTIHTMLPLTPVFEMSCRPDVSAVEMLERTVLDQA